MADFYTYLATIHQGEVGHQPSGFIQTSVASGIEVNPSDLQDSHLTPQQSSAVSAAREGALFFGAANASCKTKPSAPGMGFACGDIFASAALGGRKSVRWSAAGRLSGLKGLSSG